MSHPRDWRGETDPAHLFLTLWRYVRGMDAGRLANARQPPPTFIPELVAALQQSDGADAVTGICDVLTAVWDVATHFQARRLRAGLALTAMREIDTALLKVHPRSSVAASSNAALPAWLENARERRTLTGAFASVDAVSLIARGPFARSPKVPREEATFVLVDQFAGVKVIDLAAFMEDGRQLNVMLKVVDHSIDGGVPARRDRAGSEIVSFVPLAEVGDDLSACITIDEEVTFLDVVKGAKFDPASRLCAAIDACADSDILIAPELTVDRQDIEQIASFLADFKGARPRLILAGSGLTPTTQTESCYPFNEAVLLNGNGTRLWTHRKVAAYAMHHDVAEGLDIEGRGDAKQLMERISWSDDIVIADLDGLGRCLVLICQDLMMGIVSQLILEFRPDWVLVPILDSGTSLGRWPARRARDLASVGEARFLIVSSLALKGWSVTQYPGEQIGVAVGPAYVNAGEQGVDFAAAEAEISPKSSSERYGSVRWRSIYGWRKYR